MAVNYQDNVKRTNCNLVEHLRLMRKVKGITIEQLSQLLGSPASTIGKIETNMRRLDISEFVYYCRVLEKDPIKELHIIASY